MIDEKHKVRRFIAVYCEKTEELIEEYELGSFDLVPFQKEFNEPNPEDPMYDCYPITTENLRFLKRYLTDEPLWDFANKSYFVEAHLI